MASLRGGAESTIDAMTSLSATGVGGVIGVATARVSLGRSRTLCRIAAAVVPTRSRTPPTPVGV